MRGADDGLFAVLDKVFREQAERLPMLFDPQAPGIALRPAPAALKDCFGLLSLNPNTLRKYRIRSFNPEPSATAYPRNPAILRSDRDRSFNPVPSATAYPRNPAILRSDRTPLDEDEPTEPNGPPNPFTAPDALGWAYQYWNTEEKDRIFAKVRTVKGAKIAGADIVPATQLYTEDYMVKFLVQNSLGVTWMGMYPGSRLSDGWEYYVRDADRAPVVRKPVAEITVLDPAVGSGHFLLEAFDLFWGMYEEEGVTTAPEAIAAAILNNNLFGIDIDERAVQIAQAALWMKAKERAPDLSADDIAGFRDHLVATNIRLPQDDDHVRDFLDKHPEDSPLRHALPAIFAGLAHADELGSLLKVEEILEDEIAAMRRADPLFAYSMAAEGWGSRFMARLREHFEAEVEAADLVQAFFNRSAGKGLALLDLLARRYDVATANPPYMGSKNMGPVIKRYLERHYGPGRRDLYTAFILRSLELANERGRVAMVMPQTWMFLRSFADLRAPQQTSRPENGIGLVSDLRNEVLAHLGRHAFSEADPPSNVMMDVWAKAQLSPEHRVTCFRLTAANEAVEQARILRDTITGMNQNAIVSRPLQRRFLEVPQTPLCYWLRDRFLELLSGPTLGEIAEVCKGLDTASDTRFVRYAWESMIGGSGRTCRQQRWFPLEKGGGYGKWYGHHLWAVDWEHNGVRIRSHHNSTIRNERHYLRGGWTYSYMSRGSMALRKYPEGSIFAAGASAGIIGLPDVQATSLNTRLSSYIVRSISSKIQLNEGYVSRLPILGSIPTTLYGLESNCIVLKQRIVAFDPRERTFYPSHLLLDEIEALSASLHTIEGKSERLVFSAFQVDGDELTAVLDETGTPAGWHPLITGFDATPLLPEDLLPVPLDDLANHPHRNLSPDEIAHLRRRLRALYEAGPGATIEDDEGPTAEDEDDEDEETSTVGARIPIPTETFVEELSVKLEVHPISIYWLLKEGRETEGWRCPPEEKRLMEDRLTVVVLRLLGHRWPKQIEAGEPLPDWADPDGIIPITPLAREATLLERVQQRLGAEEIDTSDFAEVMGKPLDAWLATEFFKHHTKQFKKRPIAWQLQSGKFTARTAPAFACLMYYHKVDADTLPKLRSQYVGPLRQRLETELRGILAVAAEARSDRQVKRRAELDDSIHELQKFDTVLETVARTGFGPPPLIPTLRQYAIDDAMLALKGAGSAG